MFFEFFLNHKNFKLFFVFFEKIIFLKKFQNINFLNLFKFVKLKIEFKNL